MIKESKILFTGGSGLLGGEVKKLIPKALFPSSKVFNLTKYSQMEKYVAKRKPKLIIHAAAFTSPPLIEKDPEKALDVNIVGTANIVKLCLKSSIKLVYICTDYVFKGDKGNYKETDPVLPVNKYAWSKLGGECAVRLLGDFLIVRISMGERVFPYKRAFIDHFTSRESVDKIAKKIVKVVKKGISGTIHLGSKRRSVYEFAKSLKNKRSVGRISIKEADFPVPKDTSLNTNKYKKLFNSK